MRGMWAKAKGSPCPGGPRDGLPTRTMWHDRRDRRVDNGAQELMTISCVPSSLSTVLAGAGPERDRNERLTIL
jgi:hypothetical protein